MATYFDTSNSDHTGRLHPDVRTHDELDQVAKRAERDVLRKLDSARRVNFRGSTSTAVASDEDIFETTATSGVKAIGYPMDPNDAEAPDGDELDALLDVIADVTSHRLLYQDEDYEARSESFGGQSKNRGNWDWKFPDGWRNPLDPFTEDTYAC